MRYINPRFTYLLTYLLVAAMGPPGMWRSLLIAMSFRAE